MQNTGLLMLLLLGALTGCEQKPANKILSCHDSSIKPTKAGQHALSDACFRRGNFKKSMVREW